MPIPGPGGAIDSAFGRGPALSGTSVGAAVGADGTDTTTVPRESLTVTAYEVPLADSIRRDERIVAVGWSERAAFAIDAGSSDTGTSVDVVVASPFGGELAETGFAPDWPISGPAAPAPA